MEYDKTIKGFAESGYYLSLSASSHWMSIHEIVYRPTEEKMREYIKDEYGATDWEEVARTPFEKLTEPNICKIEHGMGTNTSDLHYQMFHGNLNDLYSELDRADTYDEDENSVCLSEYLKKAATESDVNEVIDAYNESFDNWW